MKILLITGSLNQGGAEYQILELAKLFQDKGHDIEVFAITDYSFYKPFVEDNKIKYTHLFNHQGKVKRVFLTIKKIRQEKPELIISYLKRVSQVALFAKILSGVNTKIIVGERTSDIQPLYDRYHFTLMRFANYLTVNSISKLRYIKSTFPKLKHKIAFFPNIIDTKKFNLSNKKYIQNKIKIGYVGRISPEKNILNLIKSIKTLVDNGLDVKLFIFGDSKNLEYLKEVKYLIKHSSLENEIILRGKSHKIEEVYKEIDLLCLISDYEGFSNVISEALSCGLPIITSDIEENKFLVENNVNGFVVNHKDSNDIAKGINKYITLSNQLKMEMVINNREKAEKMFNKKLVYKEYMDLIDSL